MSDRIEYQVELLKDGRFDIYRKASMFANTDDDAIEKAKDWAHSFETTPEDAWLQVKTNGKDICNLRPGEFNI